MTSVESSHVIGVAQEQGPSSRCPCGRVVQGGGGTRESRATPHRGPATYAGQAPLDIPNGVRTCHGRRRSRLVQLGQHLLGDAERGVGIGDPAVDRGLQEELLDLVVGQAVGACGA